MILSVAASLATVTRYWPHPFLGRMVIPDIHSRIADTCELGIPLVADNGAFTKFKPDLYRVMLDKLIGTPVLWVTVPDRVGDAVATRERFDEWLPELTTRNIPAAYVTQNGQENVPVPWGEIAALFIGGDDYFKMSDYSWELAREAKRRGKHVHMGRVNTFDRFQLARAWKVVDSVDGSKFAIYPDFWIPLGLDWCSGIPTPEPLRPGRVNHHPALWEAS